MKTALGLLVSILYLAGSVVGTVWLLAGWPLYWDMPTRGQPLFRHVGEWCLYLFAAIALWTPVTMCLVVIGGTVFVPTGMAVCRLVDALGRWRRRR